MVPSGTQGNLPGSHASVKLSSCYLGGVVSSRCFFRYLQLEMSDVSEKQSLLEELATQTPRTWEDVTPWSAVMNVPHSRSQKPEECPGRAKCVERQRWGKGWGMNVIVLYEVLANISDPEVSLRLAWLLTGERGMVYGSRVLEQWWRVCSGGFYTRWLSPCFPGVSICNLPVSF